MQIDWLTVTAQIVNFLILVVILKRFLYRPVLAAMAGRQERIAARLAEAEAREQAAQAERERYDARLLAFERDKQALLSQAHDDVARERDALLERVRHDVETSRRNWSHDLERERDEGRSRLRQAIAVCGLDVARKLLTELSGVRLEAHMVDRFVERLAEFDSTALGGAVAADGRLCVRSAETLDAAQRSRITRVVHEHIATGVTVDYEPEPSLLAGVELRAGGLRIGWTLSDHLAALDLDVSASLRRGGRGNNEDATEAGVSGG